MSNEPAPTNEQTPLAKDTEQMAEATRQHARREDPDQRTPEGSHDFPSAATDDDFELQGQQGTGQSDDVSGSAPASGMARQRSNPSGNR